jgi:hypothetical protein
LNTQGSPRSIFKRASERGNVLIAETTAREFALTLEEALQLVLLYATYEPAKLERAALRWFRRYLDEGKDTTLLNAQIALSALAAPGGPSHDAAAALLAGIGRDEMPGRGRRSATFTGERSSGRADHLR